MSAAERRAAWTDERQRGGKAVHEARERSEAAGTEPRTVALHTRLKAGCEEEYERIHQVIPPELDAALRAAGVRDWKIWRHGQDLFHLVTVDDYRAMRHQLRDHPANVAWQARVGPLHEVADSYAGDDDGIPLVWELPQDPAYPD